MQMIKIIIRNVEKRDISDMLNYYFFIPIKSALQYKSICNTSYVAEANGKVIGVIICEKSKLGSYDIKIIEIAEKYRRKGIGKLLINKIKQVADGKAISVYYPKDKIVENFYKSNGFIIGNNVKVAMFQSDINNL